MPEPDDSKKLTPERTRIRKSSAPDDVRIRRISAPVQQAGSMDNGKVRSSRRARSKTYGGSNEVIVSS